MKSKVLVLSMALLCIGCHSKSGTGPDEGYSMLPAWILVKGGTFQMGNENGLVDEKPVHSVTISDFYIKRTEVTNREFCAFLNAIGVDQDGFYNDTLYFGPEVAPIHQIFWDNTLFLMNEGTENYPVKFVTWHGANAYCRYVGGRLPTEAEWEYAARGGKSSKGHPYSGSDVLNAVGWYEANSDINPYSLENGKGVHNVGVKYPNELGLYDMSGNVGEWCSDWYADYSASDQTDPQGPASGSFRVYKGGCFNFNDFSCGMTRRWRLAPDLTSSGIGFRVVRDIE